jgi:hypothetical protein
MFDTAAASSFGAILGDLEAFVGRLEPEEFAPQHVPLLLGQIARAEKLCGAARLLLTRRAALLRADERDGAVSAARWFAGQSGEGVGVARRDLETAGKLAAQPELEQALRSGDISPAQASVLLPALEADPTAAPELLEAAGRDLLKDLRERCQSVIAAKRTEEEASAREARLRERRHLRFGTTFDGAISIRGELAPIEGALVRNALEALSRDVFVEARSQGRRESHDAYLADALARLCQSGAKAGAAQGTPRAEIVLHVSAEALRRGALEPGEFCEIAGVGPVALSAVEYLFGSSFAKIVIERGVDVASVTHVGRWIPAHIDSALSSRDRVCAVPGCGVGYGLERDHIIPIEDGGKTELSNLVRLCHRHHFLKTHRYWRLLGSPGSWRWVQIRSQGIVPQGVLDDVARPGESTAGLARPLLRPIVLPNDSSPQEAGDSPDGRWVGTQQSFACSWQGREIVVTLSPALVASLAVAAQSQGSAQADGGAQRIARPRTGVELSSSDPLSSGDLPPRASERPRGTSPGGCSTWPKSHREQRPPPAAARRRRARRCRSRRSSPDAGRSSPQHAPVLFAPHRSGTARHTPLLESPGAPADPVGPVIGSGRPAPRTTWALEVAAAASAGDGRRRP